MADPIDLEARLDELFATSPERFVATREALVKDLKQGDRRDDADIVHALRRPTVAVWGINQLARTHRARLAALVAAGAEVEARQAEGADARDELRTATRARRAILDELTELAAAATERPDTVRSSIAATLDAASLDESLQDDLEHGRLTAELSPAVRFFGDAGAVDEDDDAAPPRRRKRATGPAPRPTSPPPRDDLAARRAASALAEARSRAEEAGDEMRAVETATRDAQERLDAAHQRVADLEAALTDARAAVTEAKRGVTESQRAETRVRTAQRRADAALRVAERRAEEAER